MKKIFNITILTFMIIIITGCGKSKISAYEPANESTVIDYVKTDVREQTGDEVDVKIIKKDIQNVCLKYSVVRCIKYASNDKVKEYTVEISSTSDETLTVKSTFFDSYKEGSKLIPRYLTKEYELEKNYLLRNKEVISFLQTTGLKYKLYRSAVGVNTDDIFIVLNNSNQLQELSNILNNIAQNENYGYGYGYRLFIVKDSNIFDSLNFENYEASKKEEVSKYNSRKTIVLNLFNVTVKEDREEDKVNMLYKSNELDTEKFDDNTIISDNKYLIYVQSKKGIDMTEEGFYIYGVK